MKNPPCNFCPRWDSNSQPSNPMSSDIPLGHWGLAPILVFTLGTDKRSPLLDRSVRVGAALDRRSSRYDGCSVERTLYVRKFILNCTLKEIGSQCRERRRGALEAKRPDLVTTLARQFCTRCSFCISLAAMPCKRELQ